VVKYEFNAFNKTAPEDKTFFDKIEDRLLKIEERSKRFRQNGEANQKRLRPHLDKYSHLIEELGAYLNKKERRTQRKLKRKNFFKRREGSPQVQ
jgi:hypothetical protein